jgi:hypothetical protein
MSNCGFNSAESNRSVLRYALEDPSCPGKLLSNAVVYEMRLTNNDFELDKKTGTSEEIRKDRQISEVYALGASSKGNIDYEFAAGTIDPFLQAYLGGRWTNDLNFTTVKGEQVSFTANNTLTIVGVDKTVGFKNGGTIKTEGFLNKENNRYWTITNSAFTSGNTVLTLTGTAAVVEAGNVYSTVFNADDVILSGTSIQCDATGFHDGAAGNIFAAARAAGNLEIGRTIYVQGLGLEEATLTFTGQPSNGEQFVISTVLPDGDIRSTTYEFSTDGTVALGAVKIDIGVDFDTTGANAEKVIMQQLAEKDQYVSADYNNSTNVLTLRNLRIAGGGSVAGSLTNVSIVNFTGGDSTVGGRYMITGCTDSLLSVTPTPGTDSNGSGKTVIIKGSHLVPPSDSSDIKKDSFHFETEFGDVSQFMLYKGQMLGGVTLEASAEDVVKGTIETMGTRVSSSQTTSMNEVGYTRVDALSTPVYNGTSNVRSLRKNYSDMGTAILSFSIDMKTDLRARSALGYYFPTSIGQGSLDITGKIEAYFLDLSLFNDFYDNKYVAFDFMFVDADNNSYMITLPRVFLKTDKVTPGGLNEDVIEEIEYGTTFDPVSKASIIYNRFSSLIPPTA